MWKPRRARTYKVAGYLGKQADTTLFLDQLVRQARDGRGRLRVLAGETAAQARATLKAFEHGEYDSVMTAGLAQDTDRKGAQVLGLDVEGAMAVFGSLKRSYTYDTQR